MNGLGKRIDASFDVPNLVVGDNSLNFTVTAYDKKTIKTYPINVHIQTSVKFNGNVVVLYGQSVTFNTNGVADRVLDISYGISDISGSYSLVDPSANVKLTIRSGSQNTINSPFNVLGLVGGDNSLNFLVTAKDGQTSQNYYVNAHIQTSNRFSSIYLYNQLINFTNFNANLDVSYGITDISGVFNTVDPGTRVDLSVNTFYRPNISSPFNVSLNLVDNSLNFLVTASDGKTKQAYVVNVHVDKSDKMSLSLNNKPITFDGNNNGRIDISNGLTDISGSYILQDPLANVDLSMNNDYYPSIDASFNISNLKTGDNSLNFLVTASDGKNDEYYFVNVHVKTSVLIDTLILSNKSITFDINNKARIDLSNGVTDISGNYALQDPSANLDLSVNNLSYYKIPLNFNVPNLISGDNSLNFTVIAFDKLSYQKYFVNVHTQTSNLLNTLTLYNRLITFDNSYNAYLDVSYGIVNISGAYTKKDPAAILDLSVNDIYYRNNIASPFIVPLNQIDNSLNFLVTASDGLSYQNYFVKVHTQTSNRFNKLYLNNQLITFTNFNAEIILTDSLTDISGSYYVDPNTVVDLSINGVSYPSIDPSFNVPLDFIDNSLNFTVTASDGLTRQPYFVNVKVAKSSKFKTLYLNGNLINFDNNNYAIIDIEYELRNISGSYTTFDTNATVKLYVNMDPNRNLSREYYPNLPPIFDISLNQTNNNLIFLVTGSDGLITETYYVRILLKIGCLLKGTLVLTEKGYVPIETLKVGDSVRTQNYLIAITKIGKWSVDLNTEEDREDLSKKMYVIPEGRYGALRDVFISRNHRFMFEEGEFSDCYERLMGTPVKVGLRPAVLSEFAPDGKYTLYHLELKFGNYYIVNGLCRVESWTSGTPI